MTRDEVNALLKRMEAQLEEAQQLGLPEPTIAGAIEVASMAQEALGDGESIDECVDAVGRAFVGYMESFDRLLDLARRKA